MTSTSAQALSSSLQKLKVSGGVALKDKAATQESWEDEVESTSPTVENSVPEPVSPSARAVPDPPPTSPISPSIRTKATSAGSPWQTFPPYGLNGSFEAAVDDSPPAPFSSRKTEDTSRRPEKTTSVASRLIAAGIGQKPPRRTQEERDYDQAMKLQEKKRRDAAKEAEVKAQQNKEKAKLAIWED